MVVMWIVIVVVVVGLVILGAVGARVVGRLDGLQHAAAKLQRRQLEALTLQAGAAELEQTLLGLQQRAGTMQERVALIKAGHGEPTGRHAFPRRG